MTAPTNKIDGEDMTDEQIDAVVYAARKHIIDGESRDAVEEEIRALLTAAPAAIDKQEAVLVDEPVAMIQTLMIDWINAKPGDEAKAVWNRIEEKLVALAAHHTARRGMQKIMARLTELLAEDHFAEIEEIVRNAGVEPPDAAVAQDEATEREAFTAWVEKKNPTKIFRSYAWCGWKARAALRPTNAAAPAQSGEPVSEQLASMTRMFHAACSDLGLINEALGLDPDEGGAAPIIAAINELKKSRDEWVDAQYADDGKCRSCEDDKCVTGPQCVTLGLDAAPQPEQTEQSGIDALFVSVTDWMNAHRIHFEAQNELFRILAASLQPVEQTADPDFKNFHRLLCERFGYVHDEQDWQRDQLSLIEWIVSRAASPQPAQTERALTDEQIEALKSAISALAFLNWTHRIPVLRALLTAAQRASGADHAN